MKLRQYKIAACLADLHIGKKHVPAKEMKKQLKEVFFKKVEKFSVLDGIFILGDTSDTILSMNSEYANLYMWFASRIYRLAKSKGATVIWILGTASHDVDQLNNIKHYVTNDEGVDFRIYETVEETTIWGDYKLLILPDVRFKQLKDIDKRLEPDRYDIILGHGTIAQMQFFQQESENAPTKQYVYDVDKLTAACKGPVLFGHIHSHLHFGRFTYVGSFTLLERGSNGSGFDVLGIYDKDRSQYLLEHVDNPYSANYYEMVVDGDILGAYPIDEIIAAIDEVRDGAKENDLITLRIKRGDDISLADKVMLLENRYRNDKRFSIIKKIISKKEEEQLARFEERRTKYSYIKDESMPVPEILYTYYIQDMKPTIADQTSPEARLTEENFWDVLGMKMPERDTKGEDET